MEWRSGIFLILGCCVFYVCCKDICGNSLLTSVQESKFSASSIYGASDIHHEYGPGRARFNTSEERTANGDVNIGGWAAGSVSPSEYIQVELNEVSLIQNVLTQGRHGCCKQWVTKYKMEYSLDCQTWTTVQNTSGVDVEFPGNSDEDTPVQNNITCPIVAKCVRIRPITWNHHIAMRFDLLGCELRTGNASGVQNTPLPIVSSATTPVSGSTLTSSKPTLFGNVTTSQSNGSKANATTTVPQTTITGNNSTGIKTFLGASIASTNMITSAIGNMTTPSTNSSTSPKVMNSTTASLATKYAKCVGSDADCHGTGDFQSCSKCDGYVTCVWGRMFDRPCPPGLVWDDATKRCEGTSTTCH